MSDGGHYAKWAAYYDAIYATVGKDYASEARRIHALIQQHKRTEGSTLLDVACGTGGHIAHLKHHYAVEGLDADTEMLAIARRKHPDVVFHQGDMAQFDLRRRFDAVVCLFGSIAYTLTVPRLRQAVAAMRRHLHAGGVIIIEPFIAPEVFRDGHISADFVDQPDLKLARMGFSRTHGGIGTLEFQFLVLTPAGFEQFGERHDMALFSHDDYMGAFRAAGMEAVRDPEGLMGRGLYIATG
ncbi:MAG: class I SAM-dependent DNA methyltransferase [Armatimonadota bacterium]